MISYFKQKKTKDILVKNYELSVSLEKEITNLENASTPLEVLERENKILAAEKLALFYDTLKQTYKDFYYVNENKSWKLNKPLRAEGGLFYMEKELFKNYGAITFILPINITNDVIEEQSRKGASILLRDALRKKFYRRIYKKAQIFFKDINSENENSRTLVSHYLLYDRIINSNIHNTIKVLSNYDKKLLQFIAKQAKINILLREPN